MRIPPVSRLFPHRLQSNVVRRSGGRVAARAPPFSRCCFWNFGLEPSFFLLSYRGQRQILPNPQKTAKCICDVNGALPNIAFLSHLQLLLVRIRKRRYSPTIHSSSSLTRRCWIKILRRKPVNSYWCNFYSGDKSLSWKCGWLLKCRLWSCSRQSLAAPLSRAWWRFSKRRSLSIASKHRIRILERTILFFHFN